MFDFTFDNVLSRLLNCIMGSERLGGEAHVGTQTTLAVSCMQVLTTCVCACKDYLQQRDIQLLVKSLFVVVDGETIRGFSCRNAVVGAFRHGPPCSPAHAVRAVPGELPTHSSPHYRRHSHEPGGILSRRDGVLCSSCLFTGRCSSVVSGFPAGSPRGGVVGIRSNADGCFASHHFERVAELACRASADGGGDRPVGPFPSLRRTAAVGSVAEAPFQRHKTVHRQR